MCIFPLSHSFSPLFLVPYCSIVSTFYSIPLPWYFSHVFHPFLCHIPINVFRYTFRFTKSIIYCIDLRAAIIEYHKLCGLNNGNLLFSQFWKLEIQDQTSGLVFGKTSLLGLQIVTFSLCLHVTFSLYTYIPDVFSSSHKDNSPIGLGLYLVTPLNLNYYLLKDTISKYNYIRTSAYEFGGRSDIV